MNLSWQPEPGDYIDAFTARNRARKVWRLVLIVAGGGAIWAVVAFSQGWPGPAMFGVELAVLVPVLVPVLTRLSTLLLWRRTEGLRRPVRATVSPEHGIATDGPFVNMAGGPMTLTLLSGWLTWDRVETVLETNRVFVVHSTGASGKVFLLLAKRALPSPSDVDTLRQTLTEPAHTPIA